jgi:hypothetical protein
MLESIYIYIYMAREGLIYVFNIDCFIEKLVMFINRFNMFCIFITYAMYVKM